MMNNIEWKHFFLTTTARLKQFEYDRAILRKQDFSQNVHDIILKLKDLRNNAPYDEEFMNWMTEESMGWEMTKDISEEAQDYSLQHQSFNYLHSLIGNLFSFYNLFPEHQKYCFIKHGYPIQLKMKMPKFSEYIVYEEHEEIYETVIISKTDHVKQIVQEISLLNLPIKKDNLKVTKDTIIVLQYENE